MQKIGKLPLIYSAGYELDDFSAAAWVERGYAVVTGGKNRRLYSMGLTWYRKIAHPGSLVFMAWLFQQVRFVEVVS